MAEQLTYKVLQEAVKGTSAAFRCRTKLQPAGGEGTKVFPPTYAGGVYAVEKRRLPEREEPVTCVLLDSVQSQANRMEEALAQAVAEQRIRLPVIEVDFEPYFNEQNAVRPMNQRSDMDLLDPVGKVSSLQAPHRIADAILRDSLLEGKPFRQSDVGRTINRASVQNATPLFELCPTALLLGMWDSAGPKGGLGAKFARALVSEIVGVDAVKGLKTSSRIDPLQIQKNAGPLYRNQKGGWTLDPAEAMDELSKGKPTGKKILFKKNSKGKDVPHKPGDDTYPDQGRPSEANHGNVTPALSDIDPRGEYLAGGVTIAYAEQTSVLSLPALRRLRFPVNGEHSQQRDTAARTVLAALGLAATALADEAGLDLRSRCLLWSKDDLIWEQLNRAQMDSYMVPTDTAISILNEAIDAAKSSGLSWREDPLVLTPSDQLVKLLVKSQEQVIVESVEEGGD